MFNKPVSCQDGHSFCENCISQWQSDHTLCPVDRRVLSGALVRNRAVEGTISRRVMKCPSTISLPGGCNWTGSTASLENHLLHCDMKVVECNFKARGCILRSYHMNLPSICLSALTGQRSAPPVLQTFHIVIKQAMMQFVLANWYHVQTVVEFRFKGTKVIMYC